MNKLWTGDVMMKYPKQWIVMVNLEYDNTTHKTLGDIYYITADENDAYEKAMALGGSRGSKTVIEGFNDTPQIGGLEICRL